MNDIFSLGASAPPAATQTSSASRPRRNDDPSAPSFEEALNAEQQETRTTSTSRKSDKPRSESAQGSNRKADTDEPRDEAKRSDDPSDLDQASQAASQMNSNPAAKPSQPDPNQPGTAAADPAETAAAAAIAQAIDLPPAETAQTTSDTSTVASGALMEALQGNPTPANAEPDSAANGGGKANAKAAPANLTASASETLPEASVSPIAVQNAPAAKQNPAQAVIASPTSSDALPESQANSTDSDTALTANLFQPLEGEKLKANLTSSVNESARLAETRSADVANQISTHVQTLVKNGQTSVRVQLYPEDLGRIDLRLTASGNGMVVTLLADKESTQKLLENQLDQLRQSLSNAGVQLSNLNIGQQSMQGQAEREALWQAPSWSSPVLHPEHGDGYNPAPEITSIPARGTSAAGVDYRI